MSLLNTDAGAAGDPLAALTEAGVSIWLDDLSRGLLDSGALATLVRDHHVSGVTTNPSIFAAAIGHGAAYGDQLAELAAADATATEALRAMTTRDVQLACDVLRPVFDGTHGIDGRVSIEVDPRLAHDTDATIAEARELWRQVNRPNLFVKIPAALPSLPAITRCLADGISINVTLIFALQRYEQVIDAFLDGMEQAQQAGRDLHTITSVASFFVSRVDTEVDARLDAMDDQRAHGLRGRAAIANARLAYQRYEEMLRSGRWAALAAAGSSPQRALWASTSTKDPAYDDTRYVAELVAPSVVNTMPQATLQAVADHGEIPSDSIRDTYLEAQQTLDGLAEIGIDYDDVVTALETAGVAKFQGAWSALQDQIDTTLTDLRKQRRAPHA